MFTEPFASRVAPRLPIEALKVENRLLELTWRELAFNEDEAAAFFEVEPSDDEARRMVERLNRDTEGWAAGLQLALMKSKLAESPGDRISAYGYSSDVARYFETEIFDVLPPGIRDFLVRTSALDRFNEDLAAEVAGVTAKEARADLRAMASVTQPGAACSTLASFVVEDGRPGPRRA